jgi:DNA recombination protein RmuC
MIPEILIVMVIVLLVLTLAAVLLTRSSGRFDSLEKCLERVDLSLRNEIAQNRSEAAANDSRTRQDVSAQLTSFGDSLQNRLMEIADLLTNQLSNFTKEMSRLTISNDERLERVRACVDQRLQLLRTDNGKWLDQIRDETKSHSHSQRDEIGASLKNLNESLLAGLGRMSENQNAQIQSLSQAIETRFDALRDTVDGKLKQIQEDNTNKLEEMRTTVDEKLQGTLERRLGESFKQVSERLEQVHQGLGEMQTLATGVGDLKRALTNVKTRGGWGEIQLGALLEDMLSTEQYERNVKPKDGSDAVVEYAIKLPGRGGDANAVWLPIDSKFPIEDYQRLVEAQDKADLDAIDLASKGLEARIKSCAKDIYDKYIDPPRTTDFGIMFLPTEGLYAEVIRRTGLMEMLRRDYGVVVAGPSTFGAFINSLQMGFRTLAIQQRSSEVWELLGAIKTQFGKFGNVLEGIKKKLVHATTGIDAAATRSRAIERRLRDVEALPAAEASLLIGADVNGDSDHESTVQDPPTEPLTDALKPGEGEVLKRVVAQG